MPTVQMSAGALLPGFLSWFADHVRQSTLCAGLAAP
jgi:hypothetical protein